MKGALVVLLMAQVIVVPTMTRNVVFNHFLAGKRCPSPACDEYNNCYVVCQECQGTMISSGCRECQLCDRQRGRFGLVRL